MAELRSAFVARVFMGLVAITLIALAIEWWLAHERVAVHARADARQELDTALRLLEHDARGWLATRDPGVLARLQVLGNQTRLRVTLIAPDGKVIADSQADAAQMENHADRPEIVHARAEPARPATDVRESKTTREPTMYAALCVRDGERVLGFLRTARSLAIVGERQSALQSEILIAALVALTVAAGLGFVFARSVTRPLREMTRFAHSLARGEPAPSLAIGSRDEIGALGRALLSMSEQLRERIAATVTDRNKLLAILSGMAEGVIAVDREEQVLHMNEVAGDFLSANAKESIGRRIWEVTRVRSVSETLARTLREGVELVDQIELRGPADTLSLDLKATPLRDAAGKISGAVVVLHDMTRLRHLEVVRSDFVANVSHELKTPLTAIRGFVETLLDDARMAPDTQRHFLERIQNQTQRLAALVADLLTLSRIEAGRELLERQPFDLREPARASVTGLAASAQTKQLALALDEPAAPVPVRGDIEALRQVVDNLLANAIQYTPERGRVSVRVRRENGTAILEVADTGIGIEPRDQERIFERFYRVDKARSRELGGTGLGLAIVKHVVLSHGGRVGVESVPGQGSTFHVQIPIDPNVDEAAPR